MVHTFVQVTITAEATGDPIGGAPVTDYFAPDNRTFVARLHSSEQEGGSWSDFEGEHWFFVIKSGFMPQNNVSLTIVPQQRTIGNVKLHRSMQRLGLKSDDASVSSDCCSFSPPVLLGGAVQAALPNGSVTIYHSNESKVDHFHALDGSTIIGQYGDPGYYDGQMPILLSRDAGKSWTSPATVPCNRLALHNQSQFQCFSGDSIVVKNSNAGGKLVLRTLGLPSPTGDGGFASLGTEFTVDTVTGNLTVAMLHRKVMFVGAPSKLHAGCWTGQTGFSWSTATSIVQLKSGAILATTAICINNVTHAHWASQAASLALYRSSDGGFTFRFVTLVADAREYEWSYYGPGSENSIAVLSDGVTLMVANRFDGNAGCGGKVPPAGDKPLTTTTHYTEYHVQFSTSEGKSWSRAVPLPHMGCARPRLLMLGKGKGPLLLAGGRNCVAQKNATDVALFIWVNSDGMGGFQHRNDSAAIGQSWRQLSVTAAHNREWRGDPSYRFTNPQDPFASQSYTSLLPVGDGDAVLIYNKYWNYGGAVSHSTGFGMRLSPLKTDDRYQIFYTLGNPAWSPEWSSTKPLPGPPPYNVSQYGLRAQCTITFDISSGNQSPWPRIIGIDRGPDGKPCAGPSTEPCYNYSWAPSCTKAGGVKTETVWGSLCCAAGGCSPQEGNASAVGRLVNSFVQQKVPADFTGNCVLDCEGWNALTTDTSFGTCDSDPDFGTPNLYRNYSLDRVRQRQHLSPSQAIAQARKEFHQAASAILVTALRAARAARPKCHWGYYGEMSACSLRSPCTESGPDGADPLCGYDHPTEGAALRAIAEQHRPVWDESDRLFPSIYFQGIQPSGSINSYACIDAHFRGARCRNYTLAQNRAMMHSTIAQAMRSAAPVATSTAVQGTVSAKSKPVLPYMWQYCDSLFPCFQNSTFSLTRWGLETSMRMPYDLGAAGLVIWVDAEEANRLPELERLVASETGPLVRELLDSAATCATQQCSGHGRCQTLPPLPLPPPLPPAPPAPPPPGCLKSCALTPCGKCATGCPSDSIRCRMPDGRATSKNECICNEDKIPCRGNLTLCPPPPPTLTVALTTKCVCDPGFSGSRCEAVQPPPVKTDV